MEPMEPSREIEKGSSYRELRTNDRKYRALGEVMQELLTVRVFHRAAST